MTKYLLILIILLIALMGFAAGYAFGASAVTALYSVFAVVVGFYIGKRFKQES